MAVGEGVKELATRFLKHVEARRGDDAAAMIDDQIDWWVLTLGEVSKADILRAHAGIFALTSRTTFDIGSQIAEDNRVATEVLVTYYFKDGRVVENPMHLALTFDGGKIVKAREYFDPAALAAFAG